MNCLDPFPWCLWISQNRANTHKSLVVWGPPRTWPIAQEIPSLIITIIIIIIIITITIIIIEIFPHGLTPMVNCSALISSFMTCISTFSSPKRSILGRKSWRWRPWSNTTTRSGNGRLKKTLPQKWCQDVKAFPKSGMMEVGVEKLRKHRKKIQINPKPRHMLIAQLFNLPPPHPVESEGATSPPWLS